VNGFAGDIIGVGVGGTGGSDSMGGPGGGGGGGCHGGGGGGGGNDGPGAGGGGGSSCGAGASFGTASNLDGAAEIFFYIPPTLTKNFSPPTIAPDAPSTLTFMLTNPNPNQLTQVTFSDDLGAVGIRVANPANYSSTCAGIVPVGNTAGSTTLSFSGITIPPSPGSCTITISVTATAPGAHNNVTSVAASLESGPGTLTAAATLTVLSPDLTIVKSHSVTFVPGLSGATYTVIVTNSGAGPTAGVVTVTDTLPAGVTATAISGPGWACVLVTLTCTRSDVLNPGTSYPAITITIDIAVNAGTSLTNTAVVSGGGEPASATGNNTATDPATLGQGSADLGVTKSGGMAGLTPGGNITYTVTLTNNGPNTALTVVLNDPIPVNTTFVSAASSNPSFAITQPAVGSGPPASVSFSIASFGVGSSATFTLVVRLNPTATAGSITNVASATSSTPDPNLLNNSATVNGPVTPFTATPTTPTLTPVPPAPVIIPQAVQNPAIQGIFAPGNRSTPVPHPAVQSGAVLSANGPAPVVLRPPSTGDAGLFKLRNVW
jgi:uncharacterized repeat protein (TIGR01451 family)